MARAHSAKDNTKYSMMSNTKLEIKPKRTREESSRYSTATPVLQTKPRKGIASSTGRSSPQRQQGEKTPTPMQTSRKPQSSYSARRPASERSTSVTEKRNVRPATGPLANIPILDKYHSHTGPNSPKVSKSLVYVSKIPKPTPNFININKQSVKTDSTKKTKHVTELETKHTEKTKCFVELKNESVEIEEPSEEPLSDLHKKLIEVKNRLRAEGHYIELEENVKPISKPVKKEDVKADKKMDKAKQKLMLTVNALEKETLSREADFQAMLLEKEALASELKEIKEAMNRMVIEKLENVKGHSTNVGRQKSGKSQDSLVAKTEAGQPLEEKFKVWKIEDALLLKKDSSTLLMQNGLFTRGESVDVESQTRYNVKKKIASKTSNSSIITSGDTIDHGIQTNPEWLDAYEKHMNPHLDESSLTLKQNVKYESTIRSLNSKILQQSYEIKNLTSDNNLYRFTEPLNQEEIERLKLANEQKQEVFEKAVASMHKKDEVIAKLSLDLKTSDSDYQELLTKYNSLKEKYENVLLNIAHLEETTNLQEEQETEETPERKFNQTKMVRSEVSKSSKSWNIWSEIINKHHIDLKADQKLQINTNLALLK